MDVAVLGSSLPGESDRDYALARDLGRELARRGARVVCGGYGGVMEAACRGAAEEGGASVGVLLEGGGDPNAWITETVMARDLAERLRILRDRSAAWIVLPRGLGTLLEIAWIAESIVKAQISPRPFVFLGDFWRPTVALILAEASRPEGRESLRSVVREAATAPEAVDAALESQAR
jgi:uncharacterized protein (TIGR00730 family)